ncbi:hypothetical protein, partial [Helicobacter cynogastricus]|uniref:hypothetical protein n=1 Tax=Helicobacter cynogastricus TaxID=329937 RepID=UPI0013157806
MNSIKLELDKSDLESLQSKPKICDFSIGDVKLRLSLEKCSEYKIIACVSKCGGGGGTSSQNLD